MGVCEAGEGGAGVAQYGRAALPQEGRSDAKVGLGSPPSVMKTRALWKAFSQLSQLILPTTLLAGRPGLSVTISPSRRGQPSVLAPCQQRPRFPTSAALPPPKVRGCWPSSDQPEAAMSSSHETGPEKRESSRLRASSSRQSRRNSRAIEKRLMGNVVQTAAVAGQPRSQRGSEPGIKWWPPPGTVESPGWEACSV